MSPILTRIPERMASTVSESRRRFLRRLGQGTLAAAAALSGLAIARSADSGSSPTPVGACYYTDNGTPECEQLTKEQCSSITGSSWTSGPCLY
jgi:hypothetical protein